MDNLNKDTKVQSFLKDLGVDFYNTNDNKIVRFEDINKEEYEEYKRTGSGHMYFEDYFRIGDGIEELLELKHEGLLNYIEDNY